MSRAQGIHGDGKRTYGQSELTTVVTELERADEPLTVEQLATRTGLEGRTIRAILSDQDGVRFLLAGGNGGVALAKTADDAEAMTHRIASQGRSMIARADRRNSFARGLPRQQAYLDLE